MNKLSIAALLIFSLCACSPSQDNDNQAQIDFINAQSLKLPSDKWLVINYFAIWCKPCIKEIPDLKQLATTQGLKVIGIDFDQPDTDTLKQHIEKLGIQFPVATTMLNKLFKYSLPTALPTTLIINPEGNIVATLQGPQTYKELLQELDKLGFQALNHEH